MQPKCFYSFALFGFSNQVKSVFCEFFFCDLFVRNWLDGVSLKNVKKFLLKENRFFNKNWICFDAILREEMPIPGNDGWGRYQAEHRL